MPDEARPVVDVVASCNSYPPLVESCPPNGDGSERKRLETSSLIQFQSQIERKLDESKAADSTQITSRKRSQVDDVENVEGNESCPSNGGRSERMRSETTSLLQFQSQIARKSDESKAADSTQITSGKRCRIEEEEGNGGISDEYVTPLAKCLRLNEKVESVPVSLVGTELNSSELVDVSRNDRVGFCVETLTTAGLRQDCEEISLQSSNLDRVSEVELCCPMTVENECCSRSTPDASDRPDLIGSADHLSDPQLPFQLADDQPGYELNYGGDDDDDDVISADKSKIICMDYSSDGRSQNENGNELPSASNHTAFDNREELPSDKNDTFDEAADSCPANQASYAMTRSEAMSLGELPVSEVVESSDDASTLEDEMLQKSCSNFVDPLSLDAEQAIENDALDANCVENVDKYSVSHFGLQLDSVAKVLKSPQKSKMLSERRVVLRSPKVKVNQSSEISYRLPTWLADRKISETTSSQNSQESLEYKPIMPNVTNSKGTTSDQIFVAASYTMSPQSTAKHSASSTEYTNSLFNSTHTASPECRQQNAASITTTNYCKPHQNIKTSSDAKLPPIVRLGSSGTCTLITVVSKQSTVETKFTPTAQNSSVHKISDPSSQLAQRPLQPALPEFHMANSPKMSPAVLPAASKNNNNAPPQLRPVVSLNQNLTQGLPQFPMLQPSPGATMVAPQTSQSIRIRVNASSLNNLSSVGDLTKQIETILARQGTLRPGQQIRVHLPSGLSVSGVEKTNGTLPAVESDVGPKESTQPATSSLPSASRIPQLDGATDDLVSTDDCVTHVGTTDDSERPAVGQKVGVEQEQNDKESLENQVLMLIF